MIKHSNDILGKKVKHTLTGFKGVASCRAEFINRCVRITIQPELDKDGKWQDDRWFDEAEIEILETEKPVKVDAARIGGPQTSRPPQI